MDSSKLQYMYNERTSATDITSVKFVWRRDDSVVIWREELDQKSATLPSGRICGRLLSVFYPYRSSLTTPYSISRIISFLPIVTFPLKFESISQKSVKYLNKIEGQSKTRPCLLLPLMTYVPKMPQLTSWLSPRII